MSREATTQSPDHRVPDEADNSEDRNWRPRPDGDDVLGDVEEQEHLFSILDAFRQYRRLAHLNTTHVRRQNLYALPSVHWQLLAAPPVNILDTLSAVDDAIDVNADLAEAILASGLEDMGMLPVPAAVTPAPLLSPASASSSASASTDSKPWWHGSATDTDLDKTRSTINQLFRDWSAEGAPERDVVHARIFADLRSHCPLPATNAVKERASFARSAGGDVHVLVPGAGLARLVFELAQAGYAAHGNEVSYHQLLASSFMLNHSQSANQFALYPFAVTFSNHLDRASQLARITVPDVHPATTLLAGTMDMTAGDFVDVYGAAESEHAGAYDAVASVFFVDTAPDLIEYVATVRNCLKDGGLWTNVGPLLWHFDGKGGRLSQKRHQGHSRMHAHGHHHGHASAQRGQADHQQPAHTRCEPDGGDVRLPPEGPRHQQQPVDVELQHNHTPQTMASTSPMSSPSTKMGDRGSVELTAEEVLQLLPVLGFEILAFEPSIGEVGYVQNPRSMLKSAYRPCHWAVRKTPGTRGV